MTAGRKLIKHLWGNGTENEAICLIGTVGNAEQ